MTVLQENRRQLAVKEESVEGTAETLSASDATLLLEGSDIGFEDQTEMFEREVVQQSYSRFTDLAGVEGGMIRGACLLRGSGTSTVAPSWDTHLKACGMGRKDALYIIITGISGTFVHGETITGGTSSATATISGTPANGGFIYEPISTGMISATVGYYHDGTRELIYGARGNWSLRGETGQPAFMVFEYTGVTDDPSDTALLSPTYETTVPPVLKGTNLVFDAFSPKVGAIGIDLQNAVALRKDMGHAKGAHSARIGGRNPQLTVSPEMDLIANFDFYGRLRGETLHKTIFDVGSVSGNRFKVISPETQIGQDTPSDRDGVSTVDLTCGMKGNVSYTDAEVSLLVY